MDDAFDIARTSLGRDLNTDETSWVAAITEKISSLGGEPTDLIPTLLSDSDLLSAAIDLDVVPDFTTSVGRIDVSPSNDCGDRSGVCSVRLPVGFEYYDHQIVQRSANPPDPSITVSVMTTGVDARWVVRFVGSYLGGFCFGARSWLDADVIVRGRRIA